MFGCIVISRSIEAIRQYVFAGYFSPMLLVNSNEATDLILHIFFPTFICFLLNFLAFSRSRYSACSSAMPRQHQVGVCLQAAAHNVSERKGMLSATYATKKVVICLSRLNAEGQYGSFDWWVA